MILLHSYLKAYGLFVIDLKAPSDVPRFLPQGGTWDVADVQWNPIPLGGSI